MEHDGALCRMCFAGRLALDAGMLVCDTCGSIAQHFAQETQEFQTGISDGQFFRKEKRPASAPAGSAVQERPPPPVKEAVHAYVSAVQRLLKSQVDALCISCGVSPAMASITRQLWFAHVEKLRILEPSFVIALESKLSAVARENNADVPLDLFSRTGHVVELELGAALPSSLTLSLLLLACWQAREPVSPLDIVRWALNGELPFMTFAADSRDLLEPFDTLLTPGFLLPAGVPNPSILYMRAVELAGEVELSCPPANIAAWLERFLRELELPNDLLPVALKLYELYFVGQPAMGLLYYTAAVHPWAQVMALLIVAAKLVYRLDGELHGASDCLNWPRWGRKQLADAPGLSVFPLSVADALELPAPVAQLYIDCVRQTSLSTYAPPDDLREYQRLFDAMAAGAPVCVQPATSQPAPVASRRGGFASEQHSTSYALGGKGHIGAVNGLCADYATVLLVGAVHTWSTPSNLHEAVVQIERMMVSAECYVAYDNDSLEAQRLEKLGNDAQWLRVQRAAYNEATARIKGDLNSA